GRLFLTRAEENLASVGNSARRSRRANHGRHKSGRQPELYGDALEARSLRPLPMGKRAIQPRMNWRCVMLFRKEGTLARPDLVADPFAFFDRIQTGFDRIFGEPSWPALRMPTLRAIAPETPTFSPAIEVFEKDGHLLTKVDLPGLKKE